MTQNAMGNAPASRIGVVVVTRDRRGNLLATLARLAALPERPSIVVVDNGSTDGTAEAVHRDWPGVTLIRSERNLGAAGRTLGVRAIGTPFVAFSDDDSWWEPGALGRAVQAFDASPRLGLVAARITVQPGGHDDPVCAAMAAGPPSAVVPGGHDVLGFIACGAIVRRDAYLQIGGFHPRFGVGGEEDLLGLDLTSAGWHCCYLPEVVAHHAPHREPRGGGRIHREVRNALWTAWLRRRPAGLLRRTGDVLAAHWGTAAAWRGVAAAVGGLRWVLVQRRPVNPALEAWRSTLDDGDARRRRRPAARRPAARPGADSSPAAGQR